MNCPICEKVMQTLTIKNIEIDFCETCEGIWCEKDELDRLVRIEKSFLESSQISKCLQKNSTTAPSDRGSLICPECQANLEKINYSYDSDVFIDSCKICNGTWVDDGELAQIIDYIL